ncbi:MAG: N-acetylglucosamine kinase [Alphaproteobacteria bacterium]|nr:N-acetylglucosamine kinase [Alphaproteobacteria bacterium]
MADNNKGSSRAGHAKRLSEAHLFIGVDGGGSGCRARIADSGGVILGRGEAGPAALRFGIGQAMNSVRSACRAAAADAGLPQRALRRMDAVVGLAGVGRKGLLGALGNRPHPFRSVHYVNDATIACLGAHRGRDGGVVIVGTGSVGLAIIDDREIRIGGYGFPISDEGSGAALGLGALRVALKAHDGRTEGAQLAIEVMKRFRDDPLEIIARMDDASATDYAAFAPLVLDLAEKGDPAALAIVREAAHEIDGLAARLFQCGAPRVALLGGLAPRIKPFLAQKIQNRLVPSSGDAVDGALLLARAMLGKDVTKAKAPI